MARINARIDDDLARKIAAVRRRTGQGVSDLVKEGLTRLCDAELEKTALDRLRDAGFVGCADGPRNLSANYKKTLTRTLPRKT